MPRVMIARPSAITCSCAMRCRRRWRRPPDAVGGAGGMIEKVRREMAVHLPLGEFQTGRERRIEGVALVEESRQTHARRALQPGIDKCQRADDPGGNGDGGHRRLRAVQDATDTHQDRDDRREPEGAQGDQEQALPPDAILNFEHPLDEAGRLQPAPQDGQPIIAHPAPGQCGHLEIAPEPEGEPEDAPQDAHGARTKD